MTTVTAPRAQVAALTLAALTVVAVSALLAVLSDDGGAPYLVVSLRGESVQMYGGAGPYAFDTLTKALMQRAFDIYYLAAGIPVALLGLAGYVRGRASGRIILTSSLLFVIYALLISSVGMAHNSFFLAYIVGLILSGWALIVLVPETIAEGSAAWLLPRSQERLVGIVTLVLAAYFVVTWLAIDIGTLVSGTVHPDVEIYTTAEQNVTDLALYAPGSVWAALAVLRRRPYGGLFCAALVLMAGQMLVALTVYTFGAAGYLGGGAAAVEWPLPIAGVLCLAVGLAVLGGLRGACRPARSAEGEALHDVDTHPAQQRSR